MNDKTLDQVEEKIANTPKRGGGRKLTVTTCGKNWATDKLKNPASLGISSQSKWPIRKVVLSPWYKLRQGWILLERTCEFSKIQFTKHFIEFVFVETNEVIFFLRSADEERTSVFGLCRF